MKKRSLTRKEWCAILIFVPVCIVLGRNFMAHINDDLRGKRGVRLYAKEDLWRDGYNMAPLVPHGAQVEALLLDSRNDIAFRFRGSIFIANLELFATDPDPPPPLSSHTIFNGNDQLLEERTWTKTSDLPIT